MHARVSLEKASIRRISKQLANPVNYRTIKFSHTFYVFSLCELKSYRWYSFNFKCNDPVFTAWITHIWLHDKMTKLQFFGMFLSISGLVFLAWDKVSIDLVSWLPILAGVSAAISYGIATNLTKKYLKDVSIMTATSGSLLFAALFMCILLIPNMPDVQNISSLDWVYAIVLGSLCTAVAYIIYFNLVKAIGPMKTASVTFLIPIFSFIWGYLLLDEKVTTRMWIATVHHTLWYEPGNGNNQKNNH